jgi:hypothetical protein
MRFSANLILRRKDIKRGMPGLTNASYSIQKNGSDLGKLIYHMIYIAIDFALDCGASKDEANNAIAFLKTQINSLEVLENEE